jgi:hypothetical protein
VLRSAIRKLARTPLNPRIHCYLSARDGANRIRNVDPNGTIPAAIASSTCVAYWTVASSQVLSPTMNRKLARWPAFGNGVGGHVVAETEGLL